MDLTEFVDYFLYLVDKPRPLGCQFQVAAVADPVQRGAQDRPSGLQPVVLCLADRVAALREDIGEKVGEQPAFGVFHALDVGDHPQCDAVPD